MARIAPLHGTTSLYCYLQDSKVLLLKSGYEYIVVKEDTFNNLYFQLDGERAALKEDCIEYAEYDINKPLTDYPEWFIDAMNEGWLTNEYEGNFIFLNENNELTMMSPRSVILRNFEGDLRYMEREDFDKYYEVLGG
jgi:hypothetical protein